MREGSVMSWKPRKCVIALLTLATLTCFAALIAANIKPQHDAYPSSLSIKKGQDFSLGRNVNYFDKLKPNEENILMFWASWCSHCESLIEDMQQLDNFAAIRKNLFTVSEDSTIEEASIHEGDFPIYMINIRPCMTNMNLSIFRPYSYWMIKETSSAYPKERKNLLPY